MKVFFPTKSDILGFAEICRPIQVLVKTGHITCRPKSTLRKSEAQLTKYVTQLKLDQHPLWIKMEHICYAPYTCSASLTIIEIIKFRARIIQLLSFGLTFHAVGYVPKAMNRFNPPKINALLNHTHILTSYP